MSRRKNRSKWRNRLISHGWHFVPQEGWAAPQGAPSGLTLRQASSLMVQNLTEKGVLIGGSFRRFDEEVAAIQAVNSRKIFGDHSEANQGLLELEGTLKSPVARLALEKLRGIVAAPGMTLTQRRTVSALTFVAEFRKRGWDIREVEWRNPCRGQEVMALVTLGNSKVPKVAVFGFTNRWFVNMPELSTVYGNTIEELAEAVTQEWFAVSSALHSMRTSVKTAERQTVKVSGPPAPNGAA